MIALAIAAFVSGIAIFVAPGAVVLAAGRIRVQRSAQPAYAFATSLVVLAISFALCLAVGSSITGAPVAIAAVTVSLVFVLRAVLPDRSSALDELDEMPAPPLLFAAVVVLGAIAVAAAVAFAPVGSVDRWWYLAYVRAWLDAAVLSLDEPFLGTGSSFARFGVHPWLFGLSIWSRLSGIDPVTIYERAAPVVAVLASLSAARVLAVELFGAGERARLTVVATILLWSGAVLPVLARAGEDKVLAASALVPLCIAAFLRSVREPGRQSLCLLAIAAVATAAVHALAFGLVLVVLVAAGALVFVRVPDLRRATASAVALVLVIAIAPAISGFVVQQRLAGIGADPRDESHPVVRVHEARQRLVELPVGGSVVRPDLLVHPIVLLAILALPLLRRRLEDEPIRGISRAWLVAATVVPIAIAFVPPLPSMAGQVIPPWMVYRVLWLLPLAPLAAIAAHRLCRWSRHPEAAATLLLIALGLPFLAGNATNRLGQARARVALPRTEELRSLLREVRALPADALLVAAPELSERLPALAGRKVAAALDRSTVVFAGSRARGEARLRARAALLAGDDDAPALARAAAISPTHAIFDPRATQRPSCGAVLFTGEAYALCELALAERRPAPASDFAPAVLDVTAAGDFAVVRGECDSRSRRNPWAAAPPVLACRVPIPPALRAREDAVLRVSFSTGLATDEIRIALRSAAGTVLGRAVARTSRKVPVDVAIPGDAMNAEVLDVRVGSSFLPSIRPVLVGIAAPETVTPPRENPALFPID